MLTESKEYCQCVKVLTAFPVEKESGYWYVCADCGKPMENSFRENNEEDLEVDE